jgi:hypothetical protein
MKEVIHSMNMSTWPNVTGSLVVETKEFDRDEAGLKLDPPVIEYVVTVERGEQSLSYRLCGQFAELIALKILESRGKPPVAYTAERAPAAYFDVNTGDIGLFDPEHPEVKRRVDAHELIRVKDEHADILSSGDQKEPLQ